MTENICLGSLFIFCRQLDLDFEEIFISAKDFLSRVQNLISSTTKVQILRITS